MKEIKFRVWISKENENDAFDSGMYDWEDVKFWAYLWEMVKEGTVKPMQSTGLKDKNGKDVWIDDVYIYQQPLVKSGRQIYKEHRIVVQDDIVELYYLSNRADSVCGIEIIGNIHENPKLVE